MNVSVIIPVYNGGPSFRDALSSVMADAATESAEVFVVSDASTDGSDALAESLGARVERIPVNKGPSHARNVGARCASGSVVLFIDADVSVPSGLIASVKKTFSESGTLEAVFGSYDDSPACVNFASQYRNLLHHHIHQTGSAKAVTFWAGCGAVRRETFLTLGGFDESRRFLEDVEFGHRLIAAGGEIRLDPSIQVTHHKKWTLVNMILVDILQRAVPWTDLIWRQGYIPRDLNVRPSRRVAALLVVSLPLWASAALALSGVSRVICVSGLVASALIQVCMDSPLYLLFFRRRGVGFGLRSVLCHWLYYITSTLTFVCCMAGYIISGRKRASSTLSSGTRAVQEASPS